MNLENVYKEILIPKAGMVDADYLVRFYEDEFLKIGGEIQHSVKAENL